MLNQSTIKPELINPAPIKNATFGVLFAILFICPIVAFPLILRAIYLRKKGAFFLLAIFWGLFAYLTVPFGDLYRHSMDYYYPKINTLPLLIIETGFWDGFVPYVHWLMSQEGLRYEWLRFFEMIVAFLLVCKIFNYKINSYVGTYSRKEVFLRFIVMMLFFKFIIVTSSVRFGLAISLYLFGIHQLYDYKNKFIAILFFLLSAFVHESFLFFIIVTFLVQNMCWSRKAAIICIVISIIVAPILLSTFGEQLLGRRSEFYFSNSGDLSGGGYSANATIYGILLGFLPRIFILPFVYYNIKYFRPESRWSRLGMSYIITGIVTILNPFVLMRICNIYGKLGMYLILDIDRKFKIPIKKIKTLVICGLLFVFFSSIDNRHFIIYSRYYQLAFPIPVIFSDYYTPEWIENNIDGNEIKHPIKLF